MVCIVLLVSQYLFLMAEGATHGHETSVPGTDGQGQMAWTEITCYFTYM